METRPIPEDTPRTLAIALGTWAAGVALAAADGVFARLPAGVNVALAAFAAAFALGAYLLDANVRRAVDRVPPALVAVGALIVDAALALAVGYDGAGAFESLARGPLALLGFFGVPVALAAHAALARALLGVRLSSAPAKSPAARPAAT